MSDDDKSRRRTLVGLEPPSEEIRTAFRASVSEPSILHVSPRNLDARAPLGRKSTNPYGVPAAPARRSAWSIEREPSLYGFFLADGASVGPAHRTRLRALGLPQRHFMERRSPKPSPLPQPNEALPQVGSVLDKFRLDELLGVGGFGAVYRATHLLLKRQVAIKLLRPSVLARKPELRTLLSREAELVARLDHPNVVRMIDVFVQESGAFLVMEFVEGRSLAAVLRRRRLTPLEVIDVGLDVARGLAAGLEKGLIHRDIKPANIMVTHRGTAKIVDFGLALCFSDATAASRSQVVGTRGYVAPEQVSEPHKVDFRADIFSLGASLYHAAIGVPPFPIDDSGSGLSMSTHPPAMVPQHLAQTFPTALSRLLMWMLANNRADRPASYELLEQAFERARTEVASAKELPRER